MSWNTLTIPEKDRVSLSVRHLNVSVKSEKSDLESHPTKDILHDISFDLQSCKVLAIIGGSGSGKTTLLNTLSSRLNIKNKSLEFKGNIIYSTPANDKRIKNSYLLQDDVFLAGLSVFETLKFQADLRLPPNVNDFEKLQLINSLLETLELTHLKDTIIVSFTGFISLSGGEQRRLSLAIQLLSRPSILFLDEPTTGLDGSSSLKLMKVLKKLSSPQIGITVILSIHQPRIEITKLFDRICLMTRGGRLVYFGTLADSASYFNRISFLNNNSVSSRESTNFVDYIMDLSVKDSTTREQEEITTSRIVRLVQCWKEYNINRIDDMNYDSLGSLEDLIQKFSRSTHSKIPFYREVYVLTKRTFLLSCRDILSLLAMNGASLIIAVSTGWMFYRPTPDLSGIRSLTSSLYVMLEVVGFCPVFIELGRLWNTDGINFFREHKENYVSVPGFIISRRLGKMFLEDIPLAIIFAVITYFMWGLRSGVGYFFIYFVITILVSLIGMASAMAFFALGKDFAVAVMLLNLFYQIQNSGCGYFVNAATMPVYVRWTKYIAYFWYAFGALTANQFSNWHGDCPIDDANQCIEYSGNYQLKMLGFPVNWVAEPIGILIAWLFGFYIITYLGLRFKNYDVEMSKTKKNRIGGEDEEDYEEEKIDMDNDNYDDKEIKFQPPVAKEEVIENINISLVNIELKVSQRNLWFKNTSDVKVLLDDISAEFTSKSLNVIMGPSGSGKTTLLNLISNRVAKNTSFAANGKIIINEIQEISPLELSKIAAYVSQHDTSLIPNLTVRETLYFQAKLRLPKEEHDRIPSFINNLIRKTGLKDCAETLIGSEFVKGISGGEKRRVSIAIQLLSRPKILFLDEPTSGLDSSTALSILTLLHDLAKSNDSTIILTIHQPNEDMIKIFDNILLMSRGGKVVFSGKSLDVKSYFNSIGYTIPDNKNIANHILDLVSRGIEEDKEAMESRVLDLITKWKHKSLDFAAKSNKNNNNNNAYIDLASLHKRRAPFQTTLLAITSRQFLNTIRTFDILFSRIFQTIFLGIVHALYFSPLKNTSQGISNRLGLVQEVLNLYFVGLINNISLYPMERNIFYQEYKDGVYGVSEFTTSYLINELPLEFVPSIIFSALIVFVVGLPRTPAMFFAMSFCCFASINIGESLGIVFNSLLNHLGLATNVLSIIIMFAVFMGGTMSLQMPQFFRAINWINPMKYAVGITAQLGFENQTFKCVGNISSCTLNSGEMVLEYYGLGGNMARDFGCLVACLVIYRILSVVSVYLRVKYFN